MKKGAYKSLPSRYHLKALIFIRQYYEMHSSNGTNPIYIKAKNSVVVCKNKMQLHIHIARVKNNIKKFMESE